MEQWETQREEGQQARVAQRYYQVCRVGAAGLVCGTGNTMAQSAMALNYLCLTEPHHLKACYEATIDFPQTAPAPGLSATSA